jgi:hypothetical protein
MTGNVFAAFADAARLRVTHLSGSGYGIAYGSHAVRATPGNSDVDLLYVGSTLADDQRDSLTGAVIALHHNRGLRLDTEVAHDVKLHATPADIEAAVALQPFDAGPGGALHITPVIVDPSFLNSREFKLRLILDALSTPHVFLGGDLSLYRRHCAAADRAATLVALTLLEAHREFSVGDAVDALTCAPSGEAGADFLGYQAGPALHSTIQRGLADLITGGVVHTIDGATFVQDQQRRLHMIMALRRPA